MGAGRFEIIVGGDIFELELLEPGKALINSKETEYTVLRQVGGSLQVTIDGRVYRIQCETEPKNRMTGQPMALQVNGRRLEIVIDDRVSRLARSLVQATQQSGGMTTISAPMPGLVSKIEVTKGDRVSPGQGLVILEAMKMENEIRSSFHGEVKEVLVQSGRPVEKGEALLRISTAIPT